MNEKNKFKDIMYELLQNPIREKFTEFISNHTGENNCIDFKKQWIDYVKIAQIILGIANSGGGIIVFGVEETDLKTFIPCGLDTFKDKSEIYKKIINYIPKSLSLHIEDFDYSGEDYSKLKDKKFQTIIIEPELQDLPYVCEKEGEGLKSGAVYIRRGTETLLANHSELNKLISTKIKAMDKTTMNFNLKEELEQLQILYSSINKKNRNNSSFQNLVALTTSGFFGGSIVDNPKYPKEDFDDFIIELINEKKKHIRKILNLQ